MSVVPPEAAALFAAGSTARQVAAELGVERKEATQWKREWWGARNRPSQAQAQARAPAREESTEPKLEPPTDYAAKAAELLTGGRREVQTRMLAELLRERDAEHTTGTGRAQLTVRIERLARDAQAEEEEASGLEAMSDEQLIAEQVAALQELPDHLVEPLADALIERMGHQWFAARMAELRQLRTVEV